MKTTLLSTLLFLGISSFSQGQTVTYDIQIDSLVGLELTSGDICTPPFTVEEAKQVSIGNSWGGMWMSTNLGTATDILVQLTFTVSGTTAMYPTTLNGVASNSVNSGAEVNCGVGPLLSWVIDPAGYNSGGLNTLLVDYTTSQIINQVENLPLAGDPFLRVLVTYDPSGVGIDELDASPAELIKIVDLTGRETEFKPNTQLIYMYSDGSVERVFKMQN